MKLRVNGEHRESGASSVEELLGELGYGDRTRGVAVALNGSVVPRTTWSEVQLRDADEIEIVGAVQGG
ncbi:MAG: sulfur carrier protein ThiS [bacterium]|nr:sulfur carrier protein ThiS [bacterium]